VVRYTQNWTTVASQDMIRVFPKLFEEREHPINFLEIGCFEGRTSRWIVENMFNHPEDKLYCLDWWRGDVDNEHYNLFLDNMEDLKDRIEVIRGESQHTLPTLEDQLFDGIYVDGSHEAIDVMSDAIQSFRLIKKGCVILFDDYLWDNNHGGQRHKMPKVAIDCFVEMTKGWSTEVIFKSYRLAVKRT
tara:strand:+ start:716 stop:1279 length:564 start_codon:yes stop_codon:yes gene_type:complete